MDGNHLLEEKSEIYLVHKIKFLCYDRCGCETE